MFLNIKFECGAWHGALRSERLIFDAFRKLRRYSTHFEVSMIEMSFLVGVIRYEHIVHHPSGGGEKWQISRNGERRNK